MRRNFLVVVLILCCFSANAFSGSWSKQSSGTLAWLRSIYFLDAKRGWIAGSSGTLLTTGDGGETWKIAKKPSEDNLRDLFFTDEKNGWLLCEPDQLKLKSPADARSYLLRTTDGGENWTRVDLSGGAVAAQITRLIVSPDRKTAWAVGETGSLYALQPDSKWLRQASPARFLLNGGMLFNGREATLIGAGATIINASDGGKIWRDANIFGGENARFNSIFFPLRSLGWAVGTEGRIFITVDGGKRWRLQTSNTNENLTDVRFVNPNEGWATGDNGTLLYTMNSGNSWTKINTDTTHRLEKIFFIGRERGFIVGFGGTILKFSSQNQTAPLLKTAQTK